MMKIVADENLAYTDFFFADIAEIQQLSGRTMTCDDTANADALLVRSVTKVNASLLEDSKIEFVGSATIGTDHLDLDYLHQQHIGWANAAGCNAQAVAEYVITALLHLHPELLLHAESNFCLGIVGLGNVGRRLAYMADLLGWKVIGCDPFTQHDHIEQVTFDELLKCSDAISIHVPLTHKGTDPTYHLFNTDAFRRMQAHCILINSARGPVVEEKALLADLSHSKRQVVLDVFEHEPEISEQLLDAVTLVTPHIAGYSLEGKARGTQMIYDAFCQHFHLEAKKDFRSQLPVAQHYFDEGAFKDVLATHLTQIYPIAEDDARLRACIHDGKVDQAAFDQLRKHYPLRREWAAHGGPAA